MRNVPHVVRMFQVVKSPVARAHAIVNPTGTLPCPTRACVSRPILVLTADGRELRYLPTYLPANIIQLSLL